MPLLRPEAESLVWRGWRFAAAAALVSIGICLFATFELPDLLGYNQWLTLGDSRWTIQSAQWVSWGGAGTVYAANPQFLPLPGFLLILTPFVALGDHLGLVNGYPVSLPRASMLMIAAPVFFVTGASAILGADYLADTLGLSTRRRRWIVAAVALIVVPPTCAWAGHPEDLVAIALTCVSVSLLLRRRYVGAGMVLAVAILMQTWAGLLIPVLFAATPAGRRLRTVLWASVPPALCGAMLLALDWSDAFRSLIEQPMQGYGQHLPWWGLAHRIPIEENGSLILVRVGSTSRSLAIVVALVMAYFVWRKPNPSAIVTASGIALLARGAFETQFWCYYMAPAAVFLALACARASGNDRRRWILGSLSALVAYCLAAGGYDAYSMPAFLALGVLVAAGVGVMVSTRPGRAQEPAIHDVDDLAVALSSGPPHLANAAALS